MTETCRSLVAGHGFECAECAGKSVVEAVGRPGAKLVIGGFLPVVPDILGQVLRSVELIFDEAAEDGQAGFVVGDLRALPAFHSEFHREKTALGFVNADRDGGLELEVLGVLGKHDVEVAGELEIGTDENLEADNDGQAELLVVGVANAESEAGAVNPLVESHHPKEVFAVFGDGVFLVSNADVAEAECFFQAVHDFHVRDDLVGCG